ncbi:MAG TPA: phosphoribosyltransferase [Thermoplasmata archaeon]|nr:phosphoribosyltransferase [Thermoplasmata archaeon]
MAELPRCRRATWPEVERWADGVVERVRAAGSRPEAIVGLTRGGWVPARLLGDRLGVHRLVSLRVQHWGVTAARDGQARLTEGLSGEVGGEAVLVVDDITDTGESLRLASEHVRAARPRSLETAAFVHIAHAKFVPTYYAEEIPRDAWVWVVFPWNYWEDLRTLAARAESLGPGVEKVRATLRDRCGLEVPVEDVRRVLAEPR